MTWSCTVGCAVNALVVVCFSLFVKLKFMFVVNLLFSQLYFTWENALEPSLFAVILFPWLIQGECSRSLALNWLLSELWSMLHSLKNKPKCAKTQDVFRTHWTLFCTWLVCTLLCLTFVTTVHTWLCTHLAIKRCHWPFLCADVRKFMLGHLYGFTVVTSHVEYVYSLTFCFNPVYY